MCTTDERKKEFYEIIQECDIIWNPTIISVVTLLHEILSKHEVSSCVLSSGHSKLINIFQYYLQRKDLFSSFLGL